MLGRKVWNLEGVSLEGRALAESTARAAGMSPGKWLCGAITEVAQAERRAREQMEATIAPLATPAPRPAPPPVAAEATPPPEAAAPTPPPPAAELAPPPPEPLVTQAPPPPAVPVQTLSPASPAPAAPTSATDMEALHELLRRIEHRLERLEVRHAEAVDEIRTRLNRLEAASSPPDPFSSPTPIA